MKQRPTIIKPNGEAAGLSVAQRECVGLLQQALADAEAGNMLSCLLVAVGPMDFGIAIAGPDAPKLHLGCGVAMRTLVDRTTPPEPSRLLRR